MYVVYVYLYIYIYIYIFVCMWHLILDQVMTCNEKVLTLTNKSIARMVVAVCSDNCFIWLPWLPSISRSIWPNSRIKSSQLLFADLISSCRDSLCSLSIWRVLTFKIFPVKTLFMRMVVSSLSALSFEWVASTYFFLKTFWS